jgi:hypothetical protein
VLDGALRRGHVAAQIGEPQREGAVIRRGVTVSTVATNVGALRLRPVGELDGVFRVPAYQRGYRWGDEEVGRLLDDLWEARKRVYCLQPVVVRRDDDGRWELIDGQQRLTTLYLLFLYMERARLKNVAPPYRLTYDTRASSEAYLRDLDDARKVENIDFFHMHGAFVCIEHWFAKHPTPGEAADALFDALRGEVESEPKSFWDKVLGLHALLREWFVDRDLYHLLGYLIAEGASLHDLTDAAQGQTRSAFRASLNDRVRTKLRLTQSALLDLDFVKAPTPCRRALRLMNVEAVRRQQNASERYLFRVDKAQRWSLEHIHAQNAEGLRKAVEWTTWLGEHRLTLQALPSADVDAATRQRLLAEVDAATTAIAAEKYSREQFERLAHEVIATLSKDDARDVGGMHAIVNLALLPSASNSALSNSTFAVKRRRLLELERRGEYIPLCTRRVFLKYFTDADAQHVHFWSEVDRKAYGAAMLDLLLPYLLPETTQ